MNIHYMEMLKDLDNKMEDICKTCKNKFNHKCHAHRIYCSLNCQKNGEWGKINKELNKGKIAWNKGKPNTWYNLDGCRTQEAIAKISKSKKGQPSPNKGKIGLRGELSPNWKGGLRGKDYLERRRFRGTMQKIIFERDNYTCQLCGNKGDLQVDHIQSWKDYVELRFDINNCRTVCAKCHYQITFGRPMPENLKSWGHNLLRKEVQGL